MSSIVDVCVALESALSGMTGAIAISSENVDYAPVAGTPYQQASILFARPDDPELSSNGIFREQGIFLVKLMYPLQNGKKDSLTYAQLLRNRFRRGTTFTSNGVKVTIDKTPEVAPGMVDGDRWATPVRIRFYSNVG